MILAQIFKQIRSFLNKRSKNLTNKSLLLSWKQALIGWLLQSFVKKRSNCLEISTFTQCKSNSMSLSVVQMYIREAYVIWIFQYQKIILLPDLLQYFGDRKMIFTYKDLFHRFYKYKYRILYYILGTCNKEKNHLHTFVAILFWIISHLKI